MTPLPTGRDQSCDQTIGTACPSAKAVGSVRSPSWSTTPKREKTARSAPSPAAFSQTSSDRPLVWCNAPPPAAVERATMPRGPTAGRSARSYAAARPAVKRHPCTVRHALPIVGASRTAERRITMHRSFAVPFGLALLGLAACAPLVATPTPAPQPTAPPAVPTAAPPPTRVVVVAPSPTPPPAAPVAPKPTAAPAPAAQDGTLIVGTDIQPGTYRSRGAASGDQNCYWARLRDFSGATGSVLDVGVGPGQAVVTIAPTDKGFQTRNCQPWEKIG